MLKKTLLIAGLTAMSFGVAGMAYANTETHTQTITVYNDTNWTCKIPNHQDSTTPICKENSKYAVTIQPLLHGKTSHRYKAIPISGNGLVPIVDGIVNFKVLGHYDGLLQPGGTYYLKRVKIKFLMKPLYLLNTFNPTKLQTHLHS